MRERGQHLSETLVTPLSFRKGRDGEKKINTMQKTPQPTNEELNQLYIKAAADRQHGLLDAAKSGYLYLLKYFPEAPLLHSHLALVYYESGEYAKSRDSFIRAADLNPEDVDITFNLALAQKKIGDIEGAIRSYQKVAEAQPESIDTLYNLAGCYKDSMQCEKAIEVYLQVLQLAPENPAANNNLAYVYHLIGATERAVFYYNRVLEYKPDHEAAQHMLAALTRADASGSPESYVRAVFDNYSSRFEQSLIEELEYCVPTAIRRLLDESSYWKPRYDHGLDLGCGTGLGGQAFVDLIEKLDGIDLSAKMIELAKAKKIYRRLYVANIVNFLRLSQEDYDFFLAADVFAYLGDLTETFSLLRGHARHDVQFCFSTEAGDGASYQLQPTGRFVHAPGYIQQLATQTGWTVVMSRRTSIRKEKGTWVQGDLWCLRLQHGHL